MLVGVVVDAVNVGVVEGFWREALQGRTGGLRLRFVATGRAKAGKNRLHLDLAGGSGWEAEVGRLVGIGARRVDIGQGDVPWDVLADPEGNEFCVLRPGHPGVLAEQGLAAVCLDMGEECRREQTAFWEAESGWEHVERHDWGVRLRRSEASQVALVMGPPATPKTGRNRLRLEVADPSRTPGEFLDPCGNEFHVVAG